MSEITIDTAFDMIDNNDTVNTQSPSKEAALSPDKGGKKEPFKHDDHFMGFCVEPHNQALVKEAVSGIWSDAVVNLGGFEDAYEFLKKKSMPGVLLIDLSNEIDIRIAAQDLIELDPTTSILVVGRENEVNLYRDLVELGVADYLVKPLSPHELQRALNRAINSRNKNSEDDGDVNENIVFVGTHGGVGASTLAANMAWIFSEDLNYDVTLIDLDVHFGTAALMLDVQPCAGLRDALKKPDRLDHLLLSSAMAKVSKKLSLLGMEENPEDEIRVDPQAVSVMCGYAREKSQITVVDLPRASVHLYEEVFQHADHLMVVSDLTLASIRDAVRLKKWAKKAAPNMKVHFVVNKYNDAHCHVSQKDFERGVGEKVEFLIPDDPKPVGKAANAGSAISKLDPQAKSAQALKNMCQTFAKNNASLSKGWLGKLLSGGHS